VEYRTTIFPCDTPWLFSAFSSAFREKLGQYTPSDSACQFKNILKIYLFSKKIIASMSVPDNHYKNPFEFIASGHALYNVRIQPRPNLKAIPDHK